jgi:hypothetical protein
MKRIFLLTALWLAGCSAAPQITSSPAATELSPTAPVETAAAVPTTTSTPVPTLSPTAIPSPFGLNHEALPIAPNEILYWYGNELRIVGPDGSNNRLLLTGEHLAIGPPDTSPRPCSLLCSISRQEM